MFDYMCPDGQADHINVTVIKTFLVGVILEEEIGFFGCKTTGGRYTQGIVFK